MPIRHADIASFVSRVKAGTRESLDEQAEAAAARIKQSLSTPSPPSASEGSPPHLRTGQLQQGIRHETVDDGNAIVAAVVSERSGDNPMIPTWLEFGTKKMGPRPYMSPEKERTESIAKDALISRLKTIKP